LIRQFSLILGELDLREKNIGELLLQHCISHPCFTYMDLEYFNLNLN